MSPIKSVLFVCSLNSVRSPMAAALLGAVAGPRLQVDSAGVHEGAPDPFVSGVLEEVGVDVGDARPKAISDLDLGAFDLIVALSGGAADVLAAMAPKEKLEHWPVENPTDTYGSRAQIVDAYRRLRVDLDRRLRRRFPEIFQAT